MKTSVTTALIDALRREYGLLGPGLETPDGGLENNTYFIVDGTQKYVVKLYDDGRRAKAVARFLNYLSAAHLPVPAVIITNSCGLTSTLNGYTMTLFEFVEGNSIGWGMPFASLSRSLTVDVANFVANMHVLSQSLDTKVKVDHPLSAANLASRIGGDSLGVISSGHDLGPINIRQAMIHGDLARENIIINKAHDSVKAIIDFGDAHYDFITYDIATLLTQVYVTKSWGIDFRGIEDFLKSYNRLNALKRAELDTILPLMELRNKGLLQEIDERLKENSADAETLESVRQSLSAKLKLLEKHRPRLKDTIINT